MIVGAIHYSVSAARLAGSEIAASHNTGKEAQPTASAA